MTIVQATLSFSDSELFNKDTSLVAARINFITDAHPPSPPPPTLATLCKLLESIEAEAGQFRSWPVSIKSSIRLAV